MPATFNCSRASDGYSIRAATGSGSNPVAQVLGPGTPLLHGIAFCANAALAADVWLGTLLALQVAFYGCALSGFFLRNAPTRIRLLSVPYAICLLSWATIVAFVRYMSARQEVTWARASA